MPNVTRFWDHWLLVVSTGLVVFGLALALFNQSPLFDQIFNQRIDPAFWGGPPDLATQRFQEWAYAVLGATVAGWGVCLGAVVRSGFWRRERWAWTAIGLGVGLWYAIDTARSLQFGVSFNALFNSLVLLLVVFPLFGTWKQFWRREMR